MARKKKSTTRKNEGGSLCLALLETSSTPLEVELELAEQNMDRWKKMQECKDSIRQHQGWVRHFKRRLKDLERQHEKATRLTRLVHDPDQHWDETPAGLKYQKPVILALLRRKVPLPLELHEDSWNSEASVIPKHLRCDKEIFLARLQRFPVGYACSSKCLDDPSPFGCTSKCLDVPSPFLKQKAVLSQLFRTYPAYLLQSNAPDFVFDDDQILECLLTDSTTPDLLPILQKFSARIRNKADLMIQAILEICSRSGASDRRAARQPHTSFVSDQLRNKKEFCVRVANAVLARFPDCKDRRRACPLWLRDLSLPLRSDPDVAVAFCRVSGLNLLSATDHVRAMATVFHVACDENPSVVVHMADRSRKLLINNSEFIRRAFEEAKHCPNKTIQIFKLLPESLEENLELNVLACQQASSLLKLKVVSHRWKDDKRFWLRLFEMDCDPFDDVSGFVWEDVPLPMRNDVSVARAFARRHCRTVSDLESIMAANPTLWLGADEDFLLEVSTRILMHESDDEMSLFLTILPVGWSENRSLCMRLVGEHAFIYENLPMDLRLDKEIVRSTLGQATIETFTDLINTEIQSMFPDLIAQWVRDNIDDPGDLVEFDLEFSDELWENRDFVLAFTGVGGGMFCDVFEFDYISYRDDREVMLILGSSCPQEFADVCPSTFLREKEFMLQAIELNPYLLKLADNSLQYDVDFQARAFAIDNGIISFMDGDFCDDTFGYGESDFSSRSFDDEPGKERGANGRLKLAALARDVREKLNCYRGFWTLLRGIGSCRVVCENSPACLLNQGAETSVAYKLRIAEFLGVPLGAEFQSLRHLATELTKWGY